LLIIPCALRYRNKFTAQLFLRDWSTLEPQFSILFVVSDETYYVFHHEVEAGIKDISISYRSEQETIPLFSEDPILLEVYENQMSKRNARKDLKMYPDLCGRRLGNLQKEATRHPRTDYHSSSGV